MYISVYVHQYFIIFISLYDICMTNPGLDIKDCPIVLDKQKLHRD